MASLQEVPPPRRKSCNACIKAKRRCDLLSPQCTRCFQKNIDCIYRGQPPRRRNVQQTAAAAATATSKTTATPTPIPMASATATTKMAVTRISPVSEPAPFVLELPNLDFDAMSFEMPTDPNADFGFMDFIPGFPVPPCPDEYPTPELGVSNEVSTEIYSHEDYEHIDDICDDYNADVLNDDTSRVACAVAAIRNWHRSMAFSFGTSFLHRKLYVHDRPKLITDVFTSCLMYATKTAQTEDVVIPLIENNASMLIIEYSQTDVSPTVALARAQALLLYQSIRKSHFVDRDLPILHSWIEYLANMREKSHESASALVPSGPDKWDSWIFWECVSRTILAASYFINVHCLIARGEHPLGAWTRPHMWTASKRVWNAETSQEFFGLWQRRKPMMVCNIFLDKFVEKGDGDEVDAFASMLMVPCLGLNGTKKWINDTKGRFAELPDDLASDLSFP